MISPETYKHLKESKRIKILIMFISVLLIILMFPKGETLDSEVNVGSVWIKEDLIASIPFEILKDSKIYQAEKNIAVNKVLPVFILNNSIKNRVQDTTKYAFKFLAATIDNELNNGVLPVLGKLEIKNNDYEVLRNLRKNDKNIASRGTKGLNALFLIFQNLIDDVYERGVIDTELRKINFNDISLREGKFETIIKKNGFYDKKSLSNFIKLYIKNNFSNNINIIEAATNYISNFIIPNIVFSEKETKIAKNIAEDKVSKNIGIVNEKERIVAKHERITPEIKQKIDSYKIAKANELGFGGLVIQGIGKFLHVVIILTVFGIYIYLFRKKIFWDNSKILLIMLFIVFISFIAFLFMQIDTVAPIEYLIFIPVVSMLLTIMFDSRVGFYGTIVVALICGGLRGNDYIFSVMHIVAGALAAYTVRDIKNRSQIYKSFYFILGAYLTGIIAFGFERFDSFDTILLNSLFAASNAIISPSLTFGLIIFIEKAFKITTDLTLFELTDFNNPLLRELAQQAPGTFTHSITMGSMVESAADLIGGRPTLARVGAYYHDIGKYLEPENFVENQLNNINVHENLEPLKSVDLIKNHVIKGVELAKKNGLPDEIVDFIPMHHGTMVISYFYEKAKQYYPEGTVNIEDYRYSGPKPNTKETALLMLADACESAARAMSEPDPVKMENMVNNIIEQRIEDGQLDNSPLTFKEIKIIKDSFVSILLSQHHKRIRYPKQDELENNPKSEN
jgi:putative nucleotidyltransferase with HDIG domain